MTESVLNHKARLDKIIENKWYCRIVSRTSGFTGFPLRTSEELCLIRDFYGFIPDGYSIVMLKDLTDIIRSEQPDLFDRMLVDEKITEQMDYSIFSGSLGSQRDFLQFVTETQEIVVIQCDRKREFYIGRVKKVNKNYILFHYFSLDGIWKDSLDKISFSSITRITLRDKYCDTYSKYLPPETGKPSSKQA
jgi:hypothetical protein